MKRERLVIGRWTVTAVRDTDLWVDGGSLFGTTPKKVWKQWVKPDRENRVPLALNSLLLQDGERTVLVDCGVGNRYSLRAARLYRLERGRSLLKEIVKAGVHPDDVTDVVLTHLHFDHTGWCVCEEADGALRPTFRRAAYHVQDSELHAAYGANAFSRGDYELGDIEPVKKSGRLHRVRGEKEIVPGLRLLLTGSHSAGHQALRLEDKGEVLLAPGEITPTRHHLRLDAAMAYDAIPALVADVKKPLLDAAAEKGWTLFLSHETGPAFGRVRAREDGICFDWEPVSIR